MKKATKKPVCDETWKGSYHFADRDLVLRGTPEAVDAFRREYVDLLRRVAELEGVAAHSDVRKAEHDVEVATLKRQVVNLLRDRDDQDERIGWVRSLVDGRQIRPAALHDTKAGQK